MRRSALLLFSSLVGCATAGSDPVVIADASLDGARAADARSDSTATGSDAGPDSEIPVDADVDTGSIDAGRDAAAGMCTLDTDCRLFASYCDGVALKPCTCVGLRATASDPKCDGTVVTCFLDPCKGKTAACNTGVCGVK